MGLDCYKIEILHYLNPHLIWVEVVDPVAKREDYLFEQIGIYGLLPLETTLDVTDESLKVEKCDTWLPAAMVAMKEVLSQATELFFCPVHIDRRTTIFDDNIHKYGDIIIVRPSGKQRSLSKALLKSGFAYKDECLFYNKLHSGNLKTKLTDGKVKEVITNLEQYYLKQKRPKNQWEKSVRKQTSIYQKTQQLESALTEMNLEVHNSKQSKEKSRNTEMLQQKIRDLELCKGVDEESVGRPSNDDQAKILNKKLKLKESQKKDALRDPMAMFLATKHYMLSNAAKKNNEDIDVSKYDAIEPVVEEIEIEKEVPEIQIKSLVVDEEESPQRKLKKPKKSNKTSQKVPEYDIHTQNRVAYGPPETDRSKLPLKIVPKKHLVNTFTEPVKCDEFISRNVNFFGDVDSDTEMEIAEKDKDLKGIKTESFDEKLSNEEVGSRPATNEVSFSKQITATKSALMRKRENLKHLQNENIKEPIQEVNSQPTNEVLFHKQQNTATKNALMRKRDNLKELREIEEIAKLDPEPIKEDSSSEQNNSVKNSLLRRKLRMHRESGPKIHDSSLSSLSDTSNKDSSTSIEDIKPKKSAKNKTNLDSDDDSISEVIDKLNIEYPITANPIKKEQIMAIQSQANHVNPFKNVDSSISVFVDKLVTPILMVHSKLDKRFQPSFELRDVYFTTHIQIILKNMSIERPMAIQTVSWFSILRGYSIFLIGPKASGKTIGYLPAVCRLVSDFDNTTDNSGPICIIVCATALSVSDVEKLSKIFLGNKKVLAFYTGMNELDMTTSLLNGCDVLICTPSILVRLLQVKDYGVDLVRLRTFVLDDCERLAEVYMNEIKYFQLKIKEMLKSRAEKEVKVQYVLASRVWCDFMEPLAKKAPDTVICIGAFQECVLYSKASTTAAIVTKENKLNSVLDFLKQIDKSKKTVIVCRTDDEVKMLEKVLAKSHVVFACDNTMTVQNLYNLSLSLADYQDKVTGPILVCCDGNLTHMNITDAHYLVHYSLPQLFSMFCKRFSVLNDNYGSIFKDGNGDVKIKILLEDGNVEQLPKILHFIKRCTNEVPKVFDDICEKVLAEKDVIKAKNLVPICNNLLSLGECPDFWNCQERHAILKGYDDPKEWIPTNGVVTFKVLHYHNAILYSARLLTNIVNGQTTKYPQTHNMLSMKIAMYFSKESNRKLQGVPQVGDICAVSIKQNFFVRCQVVKILNHYPKGNPNYVLIKLIDEEKLERSRDIYLYHLPDDMKTTKTYIAQVRLANIQPKDKDITFSDLAKEHLKKITDKDEDLYLRGRISLSIGNCIIVDTLETCHDLSSMNKTVIRHDFRQELLESHAITNPDHIPKLEKLCQDVMPIKQVEKEPEIVKPVKDLPEPSWAHLAADICPVYCAAAENPETFFIRLVKFNDCINILIKDIQKYVSETNETVKDINKGDIVIAKFPDDDLYERARIDQVYDDEKVRCFFVDQGDWRDVSITHLVPITEKLINQIPFQAIECKLTGVKPPGENWTEFSTNWFTNCFDDNADQLKQLYVKYFTKETAEHTGGHKYGVVLIDTNSERDVLINQLMIDLYLAQEKEDEISYLNELDYKRNEPKSCDEEEWEKVPEEVIKDDKEYYESPKIPLEDIFPKKPIRSVPLVTSDNESEGSEEKWNFNMTNDFMALFKPMTQNVKPNLPAIKDDVSIKSVESTQAATDSQSDSDFSIIKNPASDVKTPKMVKTLDSDDLTSPETTLVSEKSKLKIIDLKDQLRKPKLCWRQNKSNVSIKIQLIGVENYNLEINDRSLKFEGTANETEYGFEIELYGVIHTKLSSHSNKGQYILVNLTKIMNRNWLTLTSYVGIRKWIIYDVDSIDTSSDEDEVVDDIYKNCIKSMHNIESETEEEDDMMDDVNFTHKRNEY